MIIRFRFFLRSFIVVVYMSATGVFAGSESTVSDSSVVVTQIEHTEQTLPRTAERLEVLAVLMLIATGLFLIIYQQKRRADKEAGRH